MMLCLIQGVFTIKAADSVVVTLYDTASIRMDEPSGIRFKAKVDNPNEEYKYGMVFINHLIDNVDDLYVGSTDSVYNEVDCLTDNNEYMVSLVNFPEYGYLDDITVRAYVKVSDNTYIYSNQVVSRTIKEVAEAAYIDGNDSEYVKQIALFNKTILVGYNDLSKEVEYNTESSNLSLPSTITLYDKNNQAYSVGVTWDLSNYDGNKVGNIDIKGTLDLGTTYIKKKFDVVYHINVKANPLIFEYDFRKMTELDSTFKSTASAMYKDDEKGVAFKKAGEYIITPDFTVASSFKATATIKGRSTSGTATITMYGLDSTGNSVEKYFFEQVISTKSTQLTAIFTNQSITNIKFEYTKKTTGNVGLSVLKAETIDDDFIDEVESISFKDYTTSYYLNDRFDYQGSIVKSYTSGKTEEVSLETIKDEVEVSFNTSSKGDFQGEIKYLGLSTTFDYIVIEQKITNEITAKVDNVVVYALDISNDADDTISLISINQGINRVNIIIDFSKTFSTTVQSNLNLLLESLIDNNVSYYYSLNNQNYFAESMGTLMVINQDYSFTKEIVLTIKNNGFLLDCLGYIYYDVQKMNNSQIELDTKVDVLWANSSITSAIIESLDPETIILPEGNMDSFLELSKMIYTYDDEIFQYSPTLNQQLWYTFTDTSYYLDGIDTTELSSYSDWSNKETDGLHHASMINYLYREAYYGDIRNLSGTALRNALKSVITTTHTTMVSYKEDKTYLQKTDADPFNEGNIILIYLGTSVNGTWDNGITWNREHVWPKSLSGGLYSSITDSHRGAGSDLHHIKPADPKENTSRNNKPFGSITNTTYYCPRTAVQGDVARILFYMSVRYDLDIEELGVAESTQLLLNWNNNDVVDSFERNRNRIVQSIQGNYNPFIDNPWLADLIW